MENVLDFCVLKLVTGTAAAAATYQIRPRDISFCAD